MKNKGIIAINKPKDWTSFDVVNKLKYKLKPLKVGHLGTLDPMATGVLLITVGKATKLFDLMQEKTKTYVAEFEFGYITDTLDAMGKIEKKCEIFPTKDEIIKVLSKFIGEIEQIPPKYSAKSLNGERAYDLARKGIEFELKPKKVVIYDIKLLSYENHILKLKIECGSGTYIRSIGRDIAKELNSLATMISLVRTKVGNFDIKSCYDIQHIDNLDDKIIPIKSFLNLPKLLFDKTTLQKILNGQKIQVCEVDGLYIVEDEIDVIAIVQVKGKIAKMSVLFN